MMTETLNVERQVRVVLESLQMQSPKQALSVCEKYLKKSPQNTQLLAIKALLLVYMGKDLQGLELAKDLVNRKPTDLTTLGNLDKVFVTANDYKASVAMFEEAFKSVPTEDVGSLWFFSVLRTQEAKSLFSIALKLNSMFKNMRYLFWSIIALHLQSRSRAIEVSEMAKLEAGKAMKLAEKMILKAFDNDKVNQRNLEELLLFIMTLQQTENHKDALRVLDNSSVISFPNEDEKDILRADLLQKEDRWDEAHTDLETILKKRGIFDWAVWKLFIKGIEKSSSRDTLVRSIPSFLKDVEPLTDKRSLLLAYVDARIVFGNQQEQLDELVKEICDYVNEFKDKGCCMPDMQHITASLKQETLSKLVDVCRTKILEIDSSNNFIWIRLERLFRLKLQSLGFQCSESEGLRIEAIINTVSTLQDHEEKSTLQFHLATLYVDRNCGIEDLTEAVFWGRQALSLSPDNFSIKLFLILLYIRLGSVLLALDLFRSLDIKQLQLDTLAYLVSDNLLELGDFEHAELFFHESFFIYDENRTQSWSLIAEAFSRGSFSSIPEFYEFARRLEYSIQAVACICGTIRTELMTKPISALVQYLEGLKPEELLFDDEFMTNLSDNRDRDVIDFVDHAGGVRRILFDNIPSFGRSSILIYTFVPVLFRAILFDDSVQLESLLSKFQPSLERVSSHTVSSAEKERLDFLEELVLLSKSFLENNKEPRVLFEGLLKLVSHDSYDFFVNQMPPTYESLTKLQWTLERHHWICLCLAFLIKGSSSSSSKDRKVIKSIAGPLLKSLENKNEEAIVALKQSIDAIENFFLGSKEVICDLKASWKHSITSMGLICASSKAVLKDSFM